MIPADPLPNENERLAELLRYEILDTPAEQDFDEIVELASRLCGSEISLISLLDDRRQWFKARKGVDVTETPKDIAFCAHAIHGDDIFEIPDATQDPRFKENPLVTDFPNIRFYAGQPLRSAEGYKLGTLCIIDRYPRQLTQFQRYALRVLARQVEQQLELRLRLQELQQSFTLIHEQKNALQNLNSLKDQTLSVLSHDLRSPIATLESILDIFEENALEAKDTTSLIQEMRPEVKQIARQLDNVLCWVREQIQVKDTELSWVSVETVGQLCLEWVAKDAVLKGVKVHQAIDSGLCVLGNQGLLEVVLRNLLSNAVKYTRKGDEITLFAQEQCGQILLGVRDTGLGIREEDFEKVLSMDVPFSTLGTAREKGTGLGLLLCQTYLRKMNTTLQVKSRWQEGCMFFFTLPIAEQPCL